jgi:hypothetical protein
VERAAFCDNIIYGWKKNEEQEKETMTMTTTTTMLLLLIMISFTLTEERTEWNCNFYSFLDLQEF